MQQINIKDIVNKLQLDQPHKIQDVVDKIQTRHADNTIVAYLGKRQTDYSSTKGYREKLFIIFDNKFENLFRKIAYLNVYEIITKGKNLYVETSIGQTPIMRFNSSDYSSSSDCSSSSSECCSDRIIYQWYFGTVQAASEASKVLENLLNKSNPSVLLHRLNIHNSHSYS